MPGTILHDGQSMTFGGLTIESWEMGPGEAESVTVLYLPATGDLFSGDVIQHEMTAYLLEGRIDAWTGQLDTLRRKFPDMKTIHPGHGASGSADQLIAQQREYLDTFRRLVADEAAGAGLADDAEDRIAGAMAKRYPGYQPVAAIPDLLKQNVAPVAQALAAS